jgi:branched-chain amino acid transport system ATP-binding protein
MLRVSELIKDFGKMRVINRASFQVREGEIVSLVGPNGAGKTTLVNLISGHIRPNGGRVEFLGRDITNAPPHVRIRMGIARNFQITQLFQELPVLDNVRNCIFSIQGMSRRWLRAAGAYSEATERARQILETFHIGRLEGELPLNLSEGDRKVLDIAMAYALDSRFLLLDEPTSGVATGDKFKIMDTIMGAIDRSRMATMIVEHDMDIVSDYSDRVLVLREGTIMADGRPQEVMEDREVRATLFGIEE